MTRIRYFVPNISCNHCVHTIQSELREIAGVKNVEARADTKQVTIEFEPPATETQIKQFLVEINYPPA